MSVQQILGTMVLMPVEQLLNRMLLRDQHLLDIILPFAGKMLEISTTSPDAVILIRIQQDKIRLGALSAATAGQQADATITGSSGELLSLLLNPDDKPLANRKISISGDAVFVQELFHALQDADIEWRDYLTPVLGDIVVQEFSELGRQAGDWGNEVRVNIKRSVNEYMKEEVRLVPDAAAIETFNNQLDQLKLALDRLEAGIESLRERLDKSLINQQLSS